MKNDKESRLRRSREYNAKAAQQFSAAQNQSSQSDVSTLAARVSALEEKVAEMEKGEDG